MHLAKKLLGAVVLGLVLGLLFLGLGDMPVGWSRPEAEPVHEAPPIIGTVSIQPHNYNFVIEYRLERERVRSQRIETLVALLDQPNLGDASRRDAQSELSALLRQAEMELQVESLVKARGFDDAILILGERGAHVVVQAQKLEVMEVAAIGEIVARHTGLELRQIQIERDPSY